MLRSRTQEGGVVVHDTTVVQALRGSPAFAGLSEAALRRAASLAEPLQVRADATLTWQGFDGQVVYVIAKGTAAVVRDDEEVAVLEPGAVFGEVGILDGAPRNAAIRSRTPMSLVTFPAEVFRVLLEDEPALRERIEQDAAARRVTPA